MVLEFDGVVEGANPRAGEQRRGRVQSIGAVVEDDGGVESWRDDGGLDAIWVREAGDKSAFGRGQGGRDRDVCQISARTGVGAVRDGFGAVDRRATADRDDGVDRRVGQDEVGGFIERFDGCVLADRREGTCVSLLLEKVFNLLDQGCFARE